MILVIRFMMGLSSQCGGLGGECPGAVRGPWWPSMARSAHRRSGDRRRYRARPVAIRGGLVASSPLAAKADPEGIRGERRGGGLVMNARVQCVARSAPGTGAVT